MSSIIPTLVRRGFEAHASMTVVDPDNSRKQLPLWGVGLLTCTAIVFIVALFTIEYTLGRVIPTLLIIESPPETIAFNPLPTDDPDSTLFKDPEQAQVKPQYITASFRRTLKHLGGFSARFRGFWVFALTGFAVNALASFLSTLPILRFVPRPFWNIVAIVLCATLSLTWTHVVISPASPKPWYRRIPQMKVWKKVAAPTAVTAVAEQLSVFLPLYLAMVLGLVDNKPERVANMSGGQRTAMAFEGLAVIVFSIALFFFIVIPARATLVRVQASLLPDSEETVVPFDRSFGGKVIPEIVGGSGVLSMLDAWKSFDWASRIRLIKAYVKVFAISFGVTLIFILALVGEMFLIAGTDWSSFLPKDGDQQL